MSSEESRGEAPRSDPTDLDAMGNDKRRAVIGRQYGATTRKRLLVWGGVVVAIVVVAVLFLTVVTAYDDRDQPIENTAPWATAANVLPPRDVDFKANGPRVCPAPCDSDITMPAREIFSR